MRETMHYGVTPGGVVAERESDGRRFSLNHWQHEMLVRFEGDRTFEEIAREVYGKFPGVFTSTGLLAFYDWLHQEDLVLCECESVFELVTDDGETTESDTETSRFRISALVPKKEWQRQALKISAVVVFCLAVVRLAYVVAPILEPPVDRLYAEVVDAVEEDEAPASVTDPRMRDTAVVEIDLAARALAEEPVPQEPVAEEPVAEEPVLEPAVEPTPKAGEAKRSDPAELIEDLRRRLAECRIRRDEFYLQNNEKGYRGEVAKMADLAREIGEVEGDL